MKTYSKIAISALAVGLLSASAASASHEVRRIDHPNGPATYMAAPHTAREATIGVYAGARSFASRDHSVRTGAGLASPTCRTQIPVHNGRGQTRYVTVER